MSGYVVVSTTLRTGRRWYESKVSGVGATRNPVLARVWDSKELATRWASQMERDDWRGGGQPTRAVTVEAAPVVGEAAIIRAHQEKRT